MYYRIILNDSWDVFKYWLTRLPISYIEVGILQVNKALIHSTYVRLNN